MKTYVAIVHAESTQSMRVMEVPGFSHFSRAWDHHIDGKCRYAFFQGRSKSELNAKVKKILGDVYQPNLNFVELYDSAWHIADRRNSA